MSLSPRQLALISDFEVIEDLQERLGAVVDRARRRPPLPEPLRTEASRVLGCQSQVWVIADQKEGRLLFSGDSDSPLVKGLVALTCDFFSDETAADIVKTPETTDPIAMLGLSRHLSPTRLNGLAAVRAAIRSLANRSLTASKSGAVNT